MTSNIKVLKDPIALIGIMISITILTNIATNLFPTIISNLVSLNALGNFTFSGLFASDGFAPLLVSAIVLIAVLALLGVRVGGGSKR